MLEDPAAFPMFKGGYPLNSAGKQALEEWNPVDNDLLRCGTKGLPLIMITPFPIDFVRDGPNILLRIEEYNARRLIHMAAGARAPAEPLQMGFSRGRWDGETLVVETSHIRAGYFDPNGARQSDEIKLVERFTPDGEFKRLDYRVTVTDPMYVTEAFDLTRYFVWRPEMTVEHYECGDEPSNR